MRKLVTTGLLAAAAGIATPAMAAPTIVWNPNTYTLDEPGAAILFNYTSASASSTGVQYVPTSMSVSGMPVVESTTGSVEVFSNGTDTGGLSRDPSVGNDLGNYLSIGEGLTGGSYTLTFANPVQYFSFVLGSIDNYNSLTLNTSNASYTYTGLQIIGQANPGPQNSIANGRVEYYFNGGPGLVSATLSSSSAAFEVDEFAAAVPEPATWAMMIVGFGAAGGALRSSRRRAPRGNTLTTA